MVILRSILVLAVVAASFLAGCSGTTPSPSPTSSPAPTATPVPIPTTVTGIGGRATAGPVCPVEKVPPDPACAPRPVAGAVIVIRTAAGVQVDRVTTGADGTFLAEVPPGVYAVEPQPAEGTMGTPERQHVTVNPVGVTTIELGYDTGIR